MEAQQLQGRMYECAWTNMKGTESYAYTFIFILFSDPTAACTNSCWLTLPKSDCFQLHLRGSHTKWVTCILPVSVTFIILPGKSLAVH